MLRLTNYWLVTVMALGAMVVGPNRATAAPLTLNLSGEFGTTMFGTAATLGGVTLPDNTAFSFSATFDAASDLSSPNDTVGVFRVMDFSITIGGQSYIGVLPNPDLNVILSGVGDGMGVTGAGLASATTLQGFLAFFQTSTPPINGDAPVVSELSRFLFTVDLLPYTIPLADGAGDLVINGFNPFSTSVTASLTVPQVDTAVPEPATFAVIGFGLFSLGAVTRRRAARHAARAARR